MLCKRRSYDRGVCCFDKREHAFECSVSMWFVGVWENSLAFWEVELLLQETCLKQLVSFHCDACRGGTLIFTTEHFNMQQNVGVFLKRRLNRLQFFHTFPKIFSKVQTLRSFFNWTLQLILGSILIPKYVAIYIQISNTFAILYCNIILWIYFINITLTLWDYCNPVSSTGLNPLPSFPLSVCKFTVTSLVPTKVSLNILSRLLPPPLTLPRPLHAVPFCLPAEATWALCLAPTGDLQLSLNGWEVRVWLVNEVWHFGGQRFPGEQSVLNDVMRV